jgi:hypothetical protein
LFVAPACRAGFTVATKTEARRRLGGNWSGAPFPHCTRRPGTGLLHSCPPTCSYYRWVHSDLRGHRIHALWTTGLWRESNIGCGSLRTNE